MFCLSGKGSELSCDIFPPLELDQKYKWEFGLIDFMTYNSIPNIEENINNTLYFGDNDEEIKLPTGSYKIDDINKFITDYLEKNKKNSNIKITITPNNNTLKSQILSSVRINFEKPNSLAKVLGFEEIKFEPNIIHSSTSQVSIIRVDTIRIVCNIVSGSFNNGIENHVIHEFYPAVAPGYKIIEIPKNVIYLPLNTIKIDNISIRLEDQNGSLINFREEIITIRLHLRKQ